MKKNNNLILIGFDRSGTSAISRTLAMHPEVELVFRPFNSGPIRKKMYQILDHSTVSKEDINFFNFLNNGKLYSKYIVSDWHKKYSNIKNEFKKDKLHVLITNLNHFSVKWVKENFHHIEQWAIWRDPIETLNSCVKNDFYNDWYNDALHQVIYAVRSNNILSRKFKNRIKIVENS